MILHKIALIAIYLLSLNPSYVVTLYRIVSRTMYVIYTVILWFSNVETLFAQIWIDAHMRKQRFFLNFETKKNVFLVTIRFR